MSFRTVYGYDWSENGWRMCNRDECVLVDGPNMNTAPLRAGAPAIILGDFVRRYHAEVAPVVSSVWGWSRDNDVENSNHLAGTSVDINAPQWPWGYRTMPAWLVQKINALLDDYKIDGDRGVKWGRDWSRPDEMHFQLNWREGDPRLQRLVDKITRPVAPPAPVLNAIEEKFKVSDWLGKKLTAEVELATPDGRGRYAAYEHGHIYWTPETDAHPIPEHLFDAYAALGFEKGPLGYPVRDHTVLPDGDVQAYEHGVLFRKYGQDGHYVTGLIGDRYARSGYEAGPLGWPTSNEIPYSDGVYQTFEHGQIAWTPTGTLLLKSGSDFI